MSFNKQKCKNKELLEAFQFVELAQLEKGAEYKTHCKIEKGYVKACDGFLLSAGCKINLDLNVFPNTKEMIRALRHCEDSLTITELSNNKISIASNNLKVTIPSLSCEYVYPHLQPDFNKIKVNGDFTQGLKKIINFSTYKSEHFFACSIFVNGKSMYATNCETAVEFWHGNDLPKLIIPKQTVKAILKTGKIIEYVACSKTTITFFFENESYIKTQIINTLWPVEKLSNYLKFSSEKSVKIPDSFFEAILKASTYCKNGRILFEKNIIKNSEDDNFEYELNDFEFNGIFSIENLLKFKNIATKMILSNDGMSINFTGDNLRGIVLGGCK